MLSTRIHVLFGLLVLAPSAFAQDQASQLDASRLYRSGTAPQFPPAPSTSSPGAVTVYFTNIATSPTSDVPGVPATKFTPGNVTSAFDRQWFSPDGLRYVFRGDTPIVATTADAVVITDGTLLWKEGDVAPWASPETWGPGANRMGINNAGDIPLAHNSFSLNVNDDFVLRWNAGSLTYTILAQEAGTIGALPATVTWDDTLDSVAILTDGRVMWRATLIDGTGITTANDDLIMLDTTIIAQSGVTIPAPGSNPWENFTVDNNWVSPDGLHILLDGDTNAAVGVDEVITYDGTVVIQEGFVLPGSAFSSLVAAGSPTEVRMDNGANWYARGDNVDANEDWVVRNGTVIATTDAPIGVNDERVFLNAFINQAQETPVSASTATGVGHFLVDTAANLLYYDITLTGLVGETAAHIHGFASPGTAAGILYLLPLGNQKDGVITYLESEEDGILAGLTYVNVHTAAFPGGEIRGQIGNMSATINGVQETPPSGSLATGRGSFQIDTATNQLYYSIQLTGLVGETAAHIHGFAAPGVAAGILYVLPLGDTKNGVINYLDAEEPGILAGLTYVNIHTGAFPGGEIRGQVQVDVERWDDTDFAECFFDQTGNVAGDFLVAGVTNAPSSCNGVVVLNGTTVVLREGDPIDIDANGFFDDNAFIQNFGDDDFTLFEDGSIAFSCTLRDSAGVAFAQGIFKRKAGNFQRALCFGDGSGTACPCANNSLVGQMAGCLNSLGMAGRLDSIGTASIAGDTLILQGSQVPDGPGLYFQGTSIFAGPGLSFGDGLLCAGGTIIRMGVVFASGNVSAYPGGTTPAPIHLAGFTVAGDLRDYQLWYRDSDLSFCAAPGFNLTNAVEVTWGP